MHPDHDAGRDVGRGFDRGAEGYDALLERNRVGAERLVAALPAGEHAEVLDVGCGTGFASLALLDRFPVRRLVGVDLSEEMLRRFRAKLAGRRALQVETHRAGVTDMPVADGSVDAVVSAMAFHWFPDKPAAVAAMARALRPGGVLGILASGRGSDRELAELLGELRPPAPPRWRAAFDAIQRDAAELTDLLEDAGLEPLDVWEERRVRHQAPEQYLARMEAVSSHLSDDLDAQEAEGHRARAVAAVRAAAGPRGFRYTFVKLYGVARKPA